MTVYSSQKYRHWIGRVIFLLLATVALGAIGCLLLAFLFDTLYRPPASVVSVESGPLVAEIWASDGCPRVGETVTIRASVTNKGTHLFVIEVADQPVLDIVLLGQRRWSDGKQLTSELTHLELKPGESKSIEMQYVVQERYSAVYARFIPTAQSIEHPVSPSMSLTYCPNFIGP